MPKRLGVMTLMYEIVAFVIRNTFENLSAKIFWRKIAKNQDVGVQIKPFSFFFNLTKKTVR